MDYTKMAEEMLQKMYLLHKARPQKKATEAMQGEIFMLQYITRHNGEVLPSEISHEMDVSSARVAAALNSLENKGLITRQIDTSDRRRILVRLTSEGEAVSERHRQEVVKDMAKMLSLLGEHDAREYVRITGKLAELAPKHREPQ